MAVRRGLEKARFACDLIEADTAGAALAHAASGDFDCVLLDFLLPGVTALGLLPDLRQRLPDTAVIVLTGRGDERIAVDLMKAGVTDYFVKDHLDAELLAKSLRQAISLSAARQQLEQATRANQRYTAKLRELVEATPGLYRGVRLEDRLSAAGRVARELLDGSEAFVSFKGELEVLEILVRHDGAATAGEDASAWRRLLSSGEASLIEVEAAPATAEAQVAPAGGDEVVARCVLRSRDGGTIGQLAVRCPRLAPGLGDAYVALLDQLGQTTVASVENLALYDTARRAVETRDTVMAVVSHDLRQPLSSFGIGLELLRDGTNPAETKVVLGRMDRSSRRMQQLIDDLLDVVRIENRSFVVAPRPEPVAAIFDEVLDLVGPLAERGGIRLVVTSPPAVQILGERQRIVQVLSNLLGNAITNTPREGTIELTAVKKPGEVLLSVRDTGPGIEPANLTSLFDRYWRKSGKGLGLGLFIAKAIVDAHGGRIWAESKVGTGSTFTFAIPIAN